MAATYYIDGYNVLYHSSLLRPLAKESFEAARDALMEKVARFCVATGNRAKIVFDGRGRRAQPGVGLAGAPGLEVLYTSGQQSADALIERIVYSASNPRSLIVVSGDRGIRDLCRNLNALIMEPDHFLGAVREADQETRSTLDHIQRPDSLHRIENRVDGATLESLRKLKEQLKGD